MTDTFTDVEQAERLGRRRARMLPLLAVLFLIQQAVFFSSPGPADAARTVDHLKISAWVVLSLVLLAVLWTGGSWLRRKEVRALMNDEVTRAHRAAALSMGFLFAMLSAIALYIAAMIEPVTVREAIHIIVTFGIAAALVRFGALERRAHRDG